MPISRRDFVRIVIPLMINAIAPGADGASQDDTSIPEVSPSNNGIVWKAVSETGLVVNLIPTIHVLPRHDRLPPRIVKKIATSTKVFIEANPNDATDRANAVRHCRYPNDDDVFKHLTAQTAALLIARANTDKVPVEKVRRLKPWAISILLQDIEKRNADLGKLTSVEAKIVEEARHDDIPVESFESIEQQFVMFDSFPEDIQDAMLRGYLEQNATAAQTNTALTRIARAWLAGDVERVGSEISALDPYTPRIDKIVNEKMLDQRNHRFADRILAETQSPAAAPFAVAVGFNHFNGSNGLLNLLAARGFVIDAT
ncbi:TraB/GumN family protein [Burkholderia sp. JP2-270]|uniref:TraB/GumN family protein n=1 Tax=Burkholderia sp. JP2-270 TaxID=2217913 RepID=UPI0013A693EA|nr:TraB/GumN family protein [Burkholderia sp. JP2-270]